MDDAPGTEDPDYARRLDELSGRRWKRLLRVQVPYERHLRRLGLGSTLEVGCGIGRNLRALGPAAVGVDHNATAVGIARDAGLPAFTPAQFRDSEHASPGRFDSLLASHVLEHLSYDEAARLIDSYLLYVRATGRVVMITPQERGFASDATHRTFLDFSGLEALARHFDLNVLDRTSFPFPRAIGHVFRYNEFVLIARRTTVRQ